MGLNKFSNYFAIDYMLETMCLVYYLLVIKYLYPYFSYFMKRSKGLFLYLLEGIFFLFISSENNNNSVTLSLAKRTDIQSAENCKGFSETIRQSSNEDKQMELNSVSLPPYRDPGLEFFQWLAGIIDGDGNFDIRKLNNKLVLKAIRIKLHNRDIRILTRIQNTLHLGRIRADKNKPHSLFIVSTKKDMEYIITNLNGLIRIKVPGFVQSCEYLNINYKEANYTIGPYDPYFAGLIDTDGSIVFNYASNRIECNLEMKATEYVQKLNLDKVIPFSAPFIIKRVHKNSQNHYYSIAFKYQNVDNMVYIYDFFMKNRLYSDFKFYRVSKIKTFLEIRHYKTYPKDSLEYKVYSDFILDFVKYQNPLWYKLSYISELR